MMKDYSESFTMDGCRLDNLDLEVRKINAAHNGCMYHTRYGRWFGDGGWHNLRAFLINRVEQLTKYRLIVVSDKEDLSNPNYRICDRKTYLKEKYDFDWKGNE